MEFPGSTWWHRALAGCALRQGRKRLRMKSVFPTLIFKFAYIPLHIYIPIHGYNLYTHLPTGEGKRSARDGRRKTKLTGRGQPLGEPGEGTGRQLGWGRAREVPPRGHTETRSKGGGMSTSTAAQIETKGRRKPEGPPQLQASTASAERCSHSFPRPSSDSGQECAQMPLSEAALDREHVNC